MLKGFEFLYAFGFFLIIFGFQNIIVEIDETVFAKYGEIITEKLKDNNISHVSVKNICDGLISWTRKVQTMENLVRQVLNYLFILIT